MNKTLKILATLFLTIHLTSGVHAQSERRTVQGTVLDMTGAAVRGARVTLKRPTGFAVREGATNARGEFRFDDLSPEIYLLVIEAEGLVQTGGGEEIRLDRGAVGPIVVPFCMLTSCKYSAPLCPLGRLKAFTAINDDAR